MAQVESADRRRRYPTSDRHSRPVEASITHIQGGVSWYLPSQNSHISNGTHTHLWATAHLGLF